MKVLVTGGAGFIGYHLSHALARRGAAVDILDDHSRGARDDALLELADAGAVRLLEGDLRRPGLAGELGTDYSHIFHMAAILGVERVRSSPYEVLAANIAMTETALALAGRQKALERFMFTSTSEVYAGTLEVFGLVVPTPEDVPITLGRMTEPRTSYMLSKLGGEALCRYSGIPFTIVRPHNVYGPRMGWAHAIPQLLEKAFRLAGDDPLLVASAEHSRSFCYVDDAVEYLIRMAAEPDCAGQVFNIGTQEPEIRIGDLARIILDAAGRSNPIVAAPATPGSPVRRAPDMTKAIDATGYRSRIGLHEGVRRTCDWYRHRPAGNARPDAAGRAGTAPVGGTVP